MRTTGLTIFGILGILGNLPGTGGTDPCMFGENCVYPCHCQNDAVCDAFDGSCPAGCDDGDLREPGDLWYTGAWTGYGCQMGNVAYNKSATHGPDPYIYPPERAIDGNHDRGMSRGSCVWPYDEDEGVLPWWQVDLGDTYVVISVRITNRNHDERHAAFVGITVGNDGNDVSSHKICHVIRGEGAVPINLVTCDAPVIGRFVRFQRFNSRGAWMIYELTICEVEVYGYLYHDCPDDFFGVACGSPCNCRRPCDDINGTCSGNCSEGRTGDDCQTACELGWWGDSCQEICNCQDNLQNCTPTDGSCPSGCFTGYGGVGCNLELPGLYSLLESSSASQSTLTMYFDNWTPENGGGTEPVGYLVETRLNGSMEWIPGPQIDHDTTFDVYTFVLKSLEPDTSYFVRVTPFIEDGGNMYKGNTTQEAGPFSTLEGSASTIAMTRNSLPIIGAVVGCALVVILLIVVVILFRRYRVQNGKGNKEMASTNGDIFEIGAIETGNQTPLSVAPEADAKPQASGEQASDVPVTDGHIYGNEGPIGKCVSVGELESYIARMAKRKKGLEDEFMQIGAGVTAISAEGMKAENRKLNRFKDINAYDHSRVELKMPARKNHTGFINANYIHKYKEQPRGYIATQGPTKSTVVDMWTMIWQTKANRVVMLTKVHEAGKVKCQQYWPSKGTMEFGKFKVNLVNSQEFVEYTIKELSLVSDKSEPRPVYHFHFTAWPDNGVPEMATSLLDFRRKVRSYDGIGNGPLIVHCSAGIGRTGTFLAVDYLLEQAKAEGVVDVIKYTYLMRTNRMNMIQTPVQYAFVYKALLEAHQTGETVIPSHEMEARYSELKTVGDETGRRKIEEQFVLLQNWKADRPADTTKSALSEENSKKNRDGTIVPGNSFRMFLNSQVDGTNDYVNAVRADGYLHSGAYIATQLPLPHTVVDLWRLLYEHKCSCIVMLEPPNPDDESTPVYWPTEKDNPMVMAQLTVSFLADDDLEEGAIQMMEFEIKINNKEPRIVRLYQFSQWPEDTERPASLETTLKLLDHIQRWQLRSGHGAVCFQCKYGYERSGLMIAACYMLEKLKVDREVDVFHAVKHVRIPRQEFVTSLAQYEFLHELAIACINSFAVYDNFK